MRKDHFMKFMPLIFVFSLMFLTACQESSSKKSSSSSSNAYCAPGTAAYYQYPCPGYLGGTTSGTTTGGTTGTNCYATQYNYYCVSGCPGYSPANTMCGTTTGTTTGGSTPTNTCPTCPTSSLGGWTGKYPAGVPTGNCSAAYAPTGISYTPYETRKATITALGKTNYNPATGMNYSYTSSILQTVNTAKTLFATDSVLKVRFKVREQPSFSTNAIAGYTKLQFTVQLVGLNANGVAINPNTPDYVGSYEYGVNSCTPAVDLSSYASQYPGGFYLIISEVKGNQGFIPDQSTGFPYNEYELRGFQNVNSFVYIRSVDYWSIDIEVAADGTKTFN